jgi:hypothetical protein
MQEKSVKNGTLCVKLLHLIHHVLVRPGLSSGSASCLGPHRWELKIKVPAATTKISVSVIEVPAAWSSSCSSWSSSCSSCSMGGSRYSSCSYSCCRSSSWSSSWRWEPKFLLKNLCIVSFPYIEVAVEVLAADVAAEDVAEEDVAETSAPDKAISPDFS